MRIVFFGTPELAVPSLAALAETFDVTALVCQPDKPQGRSKLLVPPAAKVFADGRKIPVHQPAKLNDGEFERWLRDQAPDLCALVAYGRLLKQPILDVPKWGFLNVHPSKLPLYRGPAPIQGALLDGLEETAVTIMAVDAGMDSGPILLQEPLPIAPDDTTGSLTAKAADLGAALLVTGVNLVASGQARFVPQNDELATYTKLFEKNDGRIDWTRPAAQIHNLVRATNPWPGAQCRLKGKAIQILRTAVVDPDSVDSPGAIVRADKHGFYVATGSGHLEILELQVAGKQPVSAAAFLNGARVAAGEHFESSA